MLDPIAIVSYCDCRICNTPVPPHMQDSWMQGLSDWSRVPDNTIPSEERSAILLGFKRFRYPAEAFNVGQMIKNHFPGTADNEMSPTIAADFEPAALIDLCNFELCRLIPITTESVAELTVEVVDLSLNIAKIRESENCQRRAMRKRYIWDTEEWCRLIFKEFDQIRQHLQANQFVVYVVPWLLGCVKIHLGLQEDGRDPQERRRGTSIDQAQCVTSSYRRSITLRRRKLIVENNICLCIRLGTDGEIESI